MVKQWRENKNLGKENSSSLKISSNTSSPMPEWNLDHRWFLKSRNPHFSWYLVSIYLKAGHSKGT